MTTMRISFLVLSFGVLAVGLVHLRSEQVRSAAVALKWESEWINLRRETWKVQAEIARLRAPGSIHDRTKWFQTDLVAPSTPTGMGKGERLAFSH